MYTNEWISVCVCACVYARCRPKEEIEKKNHLYCIYIEILCVLRLRYVCLAAGIKNQRVRDTHAYNAVRFPYDCVSAAVAAADGL